MTAQCKEKERKIWIHEKKNNDWKKKVFCESQIKLKKNYLVHIHQQQQHRFDDTIRVILILFIFKL